MPTLQPKSSPRRRDLPALIWQALAVLVLSLGSTLADATCSCDEARKIHEWCETHQVGWAAGIQIPSRMLWEAIDAHGHEVDPDSIDCEGCLAAMAADGYCEIHFMGFVGGEAYFSRLAYLMAQGSVVEPAKVDCAICRENAETSGWCERHGRGMLGAVAIDDRSAWEQAQRAYRVLLLAIEKAESCELCASAMVGDGRCPVHRTSYEDGKAKLD